MQDGIKVQAGKIPKINKRAGWNKAVQDGKFQFLLVKIKVLAKKFPKLINVQDGISLCRMDFFQKRIRFCCTIIQETRVPTHLPTYLPTLEYLINVGVRLLIL